MNLKGSLKSTENRLLKAIDESQSELARITSAGFDHAEKDQEQLARIVKNGFDHVMDNLDVRERMLKVEAKVQKIEMAIHLEL